MRRYSARHQHQPGGNSEHRAGRAGDTGRRTGCLADGGQARAANQTGSGFQTRQQTAGDDGEPTAGDASRADSPFPGSRIPTGHDDPCTQPHAARSNAADAAGDAAGATGADPTARADAAPRTGRRCLRDLRQGRGSPRHPRCGPRIRAVCQSEQ